MPNWYNGYVPMQNYSQPYYNVMGSNVLPQQQQMPIQMQQQAQVQQQPTDSRIWVQGEQSAKSYLVAPNVTVELWDSEKQVIYLKTADANGVPSMRILEYTYKDNQQNVPMNAEKAASVDFATKDDIKALSERIDALNGKYEGLTKHGKKKGEIEDDE